MKKPIYLLYAAFVLALTGMLGSLFFSEVMGFAPCALCWYQRITLYPLVLILLIGIWINDRQVWKYVLPLTIIGTVISIYHNLLYYGIIPHQFAPCDASASCTQPYINWLGFITIPFLSLVAHATIVGLLCWYKKLTHSKQ